MKSLKDIQISQKTKDLLKGTLAILLIVIFTGASISVANSYNKKNMDKINAAAAQRQEELRKKADSAIAVNQRMELQLQRLDSDVQILNTNQQTLNRTLSSEFSKLKQIQKNEKNYIPTATVNEQLDFISNYRYTPID